MLALNENPPMTYPEGASLHEVDAPWWVAHTRARHEKALAFGLVNSGTSFFLPMVEKTRLIRRRRFRSLMPLFPGYLFFAGGIEAREQVLSSRHVAKTIRVLDQPRLLHELLQIERALKARSELDPFPYLKRGKRCRVRSGPLRGVQGTVVRRRGTTLLVLQVDMLGQSVATEIDPALVDPDD
jgi:transcription antitermination factor NusG